ncbi:hypothetical protein AB0M48_38735 [Lentzea sp. NPDC051208]|uniref:hypothetical protein n=1 Tax=Lentzea sp. NPDC051208 TaxID=3154642 RepID=UPI00343EE834
MSDITMSPLRKSWMERTMTDSRDLHLRDTPVVLLGANGCAGRMHGNVYERLGAPVYRVDVAEHPLKYWEGRLPWQDAVVDVCTPTGEHASCIRWAHELGARRFLVEKPAARSLSEWRSTLDVLNDSQVLGVQNYLFSAAFRAARAALPEVHRISSGFDKLRAFDDFAGRGADRFGELPHVVEVEMPHQFAMALSVRPDLAVTRMTEHAFGVRAGQSKAAVSCSVELAAPGVTAVLSSNLRAPRRRWIRLESPDGRYAHCDFPDRAGASRAYEGNQLGAVSVLFAGEDDMLQACLAAAVRTFHTGEAAPPDLAVDLVTSVERCIEDALYEVDDGASGSPIAV